MMRGRNFKLFEISTIMTQRDTVMRIDPPRKDAAPSRAYLKISPVISKQIRKKGRDLRDDDLVEVKPRVTQTQNFNNDVTIFSTYCSLLFGKILISCTMFFFLARHPPLTPLIFPSYVGELNTSYY